MLTHGGLLCIALRQLLFFVFEPTCAMHCTLLYASLSVYLLPGSLGRWMIFIDSVALAKPGSNRFVRPFDLCAIKKLPA